MPVRNRKTDKNQLNMVKGLLRTFIQIYYRRDGPYWMCKMNKPETADMIIKVGDKLTGIDYEIMILGYDPETDKYTVNIFNFSGNLIGPHRIIDGDIIRTIFRKL